MIMGLVPLILLKRKTTNSGQPDTQLGHSVTVTLIKNIFIFLYLDIDQTEEEAQDFRRV